MTEDPVSHQRQGSGFDVPAQFHLPRHYVSQMVDVFAARTGAVSEIALFAVTLQIGRDAMDAALFALWIAI